MQSVKIQVRYGRNYQKNNLFSFLLSMKFLIGDKHEWIVLQKPSQWLLFRVSKQAVNGLDCNQKQINNNRSLFLLIALFTVRNMFLLLLKFKVRVFLNDLQVLRLYVCLFTFTINRLNLTLQHGKLWFLTCDLKRKFVLYDNVPKSIQILNSHQLDMYLGIYHIMNGLVG